MTKKQGSEQLINSLEDIPKVKEGPVVTEETEPIKPDPQPMREQKKNEVRDKTDLQSPGQIVEWAMRDALKNHQEVTAAIDHLISMLNLTSVQRQDVWDYYHKLKDRNRRTAKFLYKVVDEIGNGFENFRESFEYLACDMPKEERYHAKRMARKAGFDI